MNNFLKEKKTFIVAEISANHNQDFDLAVQTIKAMKESGADAVKFQTYTPDSLSLDVNNEYFGPKKDGLWKGKKPYDLYKEAAMPWEWQPKLKKIAEEIGLLCFSTPFDFKAVDFLEAMDVPIYKIASPEINDIPLIKYIASKGKPVIISTGIANKEDIELALKTCREVGNNNISILKCTSQYPAPIEAANLATLIDMKKRFSIDVGVSDHTLGIIVPIVAVSLGAKIVEKHFILDRKLGGPDSPFSMEPAEFKIMVKEIRLAEKSLGKVSYVLRDKDRKRRRSLFVIEDVKRGEKLNKKNVKSIRPGNGLSPIYLDQILGRVVKVDIKKGTPLKKKLIR